MELINVTPFKFASLVGRVNYPSYTLTLIIKGSFDLGPDKICRVSKEQPYPDGDVPYEDDGQGAGETRYPSDFAYFKPRADLLLTGKCHPPSGKPAQACRVTFQAGDVIKSLGVFGNRYWNNPLKTISDPEPFTQMALRYANGFGGDGYEKNPVGKGFGKLVTETGLKIHPLPNIEDLQHLIGSPMHHPEPAGFGPLGQMWPQRFTKLGTYRGNWLRQRWPWFPADFDWGYFNAAPADMQVEGYLKGDEKLFFENLHPVHSRYHSCLPGLSIRCFLDEFEAVNGTGTAWREVKMNLDTLWVDMDNEKMVLVWRGVAGVQSEQYDDIRHIFVSSEKLEGSGRTVDYYRRQFNDQLAAMAAERQLEIAEPETEHHIADNANDMDEQIAEIEATMRKEMIAAGIDPDAQLPPASAKTKKEEAGILKAVGMAPEAARPPLTRETVRRGLGRGEHFADENLSGLDLSGLDLQGIDFQDAILSGTSFKDSNLSGADFSHANLAGADLWGAKLNDALLQQADLTAAQITEAHLTGANLEDAILEKADLHHALLDHVKAGDAIFCGADLTGASLQNSTFDGADFSNCILNNTDFRGSSLREASVQGAVGSNMNMSKTDLTELRASGGCKFDQASFQYAMGIESIWEASALNQADFSFSCMEGADFSSAGLVQADFTASNMKFARFTKADLTGAAMSVMNLFEGSFEKANLTMTDLAGSNLYGVEFFESTIEGANFDAANLKMTKLARLGT